jgi:hypothetical protein
MSVDLTTVHTQTITVQTLQIQSLQEAPDMQPVERVMPHQQQHQPSATDNCGIAAVSNLHGECKN